MVGMNARHNRHVGLEVRSHLERELFLTSFTALVTVILLLVVWWHLVAFIGVLEQQNL